MYKDQEEVNKVYREHLDSLRVSGLPFDETSILAAWADALAEFEED